MKTITHLPMKALYNHRKTPDEFIKETLSHLDILESTRADYLIKIKLFLQFISSKGFHKNSFLEFKQHLRLRTQYSVSTKNKYMAATRIFLKEMYRLQYIPVDITQNIKAFTQTKIHKKEGLNETEIQKVISFLKHKEPSPSNSRIKAIVALLLLQGLRQIEIIRLNLSDIDLHNKTAFIHGKGDDDKTPIHLHPITVRLLQQYIYANQIQQGALFFSKSNNSKNKRLSTKTIRVIVKTLFKQLTISNSTHGFRHYYTTLLVKSYKGNLLMVSKYTRHRSIEMLQVYNDSIIRKNDLPQYYNVFRNIDF